MKAPDKQKTHNLPGLLLGAALASDGNTFYAGCMDGVYRLDMEEDSF